MHLFSLVRYENFKKVNRASRRGDVMDDQDVISSRKLGSKMEIENVRIDLNESRDTIFINVWQLIFYMLLRGVHLISGRSVSAQRQSA
jgi:hypothetical protein